MNFISFHSCFVTIVQIVLSLETILVLVFFFFGLNMFKDVHQRASFIALMHAVGL